MAKRRLITAIPQERLTERLLEKQPRLDYVTYSM